MAYQMTARRFANLDRSRASIHLSKHRAYLASHDFLQPLLATSDPPELVFDRCKNALFTHWVKTKNDEANERFANKQNAPKSPSSRYVVKIFGMVNGNLEVLTANHFRMSESGEVERVVKPMVYPAADYASGERLADRRLFDRSDSVFAEIVNTEGVVIRTRIERQDAIARILAKPKHAVMKGGKRTSSLKWLPKAHPTRNATPWHIAR
jgi:hypothetical protein